MNDSKMRPRILDVETGFAPEEARHNPVWHDVMDYQIYSRWPKWWRDFEKRIRLDIGLAIEVNRRAENYDIIWVWSEKAGIPLSFLPISKPVILVLHNLKTVQKWVIKALALTKKCAGIGYISDVDKKILMQEFQVPVERLVRCIDAPIDEVQPGPSVADGYILSVGTAKRDYETLFKALEHCRGFETRIFATSKYGDLFQGGKNLHSPRSVHFMQKVSREELIVQYQNSRFVVIPLEKSAHAGAGSTVALEASAAGRAVIATRTEGMPSFIQDGITGILVPPNDPQALQHAINYLASHPEAAHKMGMAGRRFVEDKFNPKDNNKRIMSLIERVYSESYPHAFTCSAD